MINFKTYLLEKEEKDKEELGKRVKVSGDEREDYSSTVYNLVEKAFEMIDKDSIFDDEDDMLEQSKYWELLINDDKVVCAMLYDEKGSDKTLIAVGCKNNSKSKEGLEGLISKAYDNGLEEDNISKDVRKFIKSQLFDTEDDDDETIYRQRRGFGYPLWGFMPGFMGIGMGMRHHRPMGGRHHHGGHGRPPMGGGRPPMGGGDFGGGHGGGMPPAGCGDVGGSMGGGDGGAAAGGDAGGGGE